MNEERNKTLGQMTLEEKASLCSGKNFWQLKGVERLGIPEIMVTDGPHGLRKQAGDADHLGLNVSVAATCFPPACTSASGWDRQALYEMGQAIGEECAEEDVSVILGPGVNLKRSPLCGRNFEYFSEDPFLAGECGASWVLGVQSRGVGTSLKHYAANNQETSRLVGNSVVDERALRELYLAAFETTVKKAKPWTLMCSYNRINGVYGCENPYTLDQCLRKEWGFDGIVMTDWGAMNQRVDALMAGLELEMPGPSDYNDRKIIEGVKQGTLSEDTLNQSVSRILDLIEKSGQKEKGKKYSREDHHNLARKLAAESFVLLQNRDSVLPLSSGKDYGILGTFSTNPRYQGAGSSKINPHKVDNLPDAMAKEGYSFEDLGGYEITREMLDQAAKKDGIIIVAGLPDEYESEGYDRTHLNMPDCHNKLIEAVSQVNEHVIVVLMCGSPVLMPWKDQVKGILLTYLPGEAAGTSIVDVLSGRVNPCGKLAETFPMKLEDTPAYLNYGGEGMDVEYRESIFVGYRYYDWAQKEVLFPFGFGLSYTEFRYENMEVVWEDERKEGKVLITVTNTGKRKGKEVVQLYIGMKDSRIMRPVKELKGFEKMELEPGEQKTVTMCLDARSFSFYSVDRKDWCVEDGCYQIYAAASCNDIRLTEEIRVKGETLVEWIPYRPETVIKDGVLEVPKELFENLFPGELPYLPKTREVTVNSRLGEVLQTKAGKEVFGYLDERARALFSGDDDGSRMMLSMLTDIPLRSLSMFSAGMTDMDTIMEMIQKVNQESL